MSAARRRGNGPAVQTKKPSKAAPAPAPVSAAPRIPVPAAVTGLAQRYAGFAAQPPQYDPAAGQAAFEALARDRAAIAKIQVARVDVQAAALAALAVQAFVAQAPALREQLQALDGAGLFSTSAIEDLKTASFAVLYAFLRAEAAGAFDTGAVVPPKIVTEATAMEKRMQKRCEFLFADDPEVAPLLAKLRPGTGHNDLANDLLGYADIYETRPARVAGADPSYRASDLADARRLAGEIMACLTGAMAPQARTAYEDLQRSYMVLLSIYAEVQAAGLFLCRFDPQRLERFPSLTTAARAAAPRRKKKEPAAEAAPKAGT